MLTDIKTKLYVKETTKMDFLENLNNRLKKLSLIDFGFFKMAIIFGVLMVAKLIPQILEINIWWFVVLFVICAIKPFYLFFNKN